MDEKLSLVFLAATGVVVLSVGSGTFSAVGLYCRKRKVGGTMMPMLAAASVIQTLGIVLGFMIAGYFEVSLLSTVSFGLGMGAAYFGIKMAELAGRQLGKTPMRD